jgi:CDP-diacylglycerol---glycerol-3-phosphate 3-phosphatidyltransferase
VTSRQPQRLRPLRDEITDLPNLITLARIAMIPLVLVFIDNFSRELSALSAAIFLIAAASDALDGYLARRLGLVTVVGKFLDPLADKLIVLSTLVMLVAVDRAPAWLVVVLMARELSITGLRAIASQEGYVIAAGAGGKVKTAFQVIGIAFLLVHFPYEILFFNVTVDFHQIGIYVLYLSLVMSVLSAFEYFRFFVEAASKQAKELEAQGITRQALKEKAREARRARHLAKQSLRLQKREARRARGRGRGRRFPRKRRGSDR